jgi:hypothetical protein
MRVSESMQDRMLPFYAREIRIAVSAAADHFAGEMDSENVRQPKILATLIRIGIHAGFERRQQ